MWRTDGRCGAVAGSPQLEDLHRAGQALRLVAHALRRGRRLLYQCRVLLRHLVELVDRRVDLADALGLLGSGCRDLANDVAHALHRAHDLVHGGSGVLHQARARFDLLDRCADELLDLARGLGRAAGQVAHLAGHHGKAPALLARASGFHGGVEREDVGLEGNAVDHADDVGNAARALVDLAHGGHHLAHHLAAARRHFSCRTGQLVGLAGRIGRLAHRGGEFLHALRRGLQAAGGLFRAGREVLVAAGDLGAGGVDVVHGRAHFLQHLQVAQAHGIHFLHQRADLVALRGVEGLRQVALGHQGDRLGQLAQGLADAAAQHDEQPGGQQHHGHGHHAPHGQHHLELAGHGLAVGHFGHHPPAIGLGLAHQGPWVLGRTTKDVGRLAHKTVGRCRQGFEERPGLGVGLQHLLAACRRVGHEHGLVQPAARVNHIGAAVFEELGLGHLFLQHALEHADVVADEQQRNHLAPRVLAGQVVTHVGLALHHDAAGVGLACARLVQRRPGFQQATHVALPLGVLGRGGDAHEIVALARKHGGNAPGFLGELVHRAVVFVDQAAVAAQFTRALVELHGGFEITLKARHVEVHQLAVGGVGRVERLGHAARRVAHTAHHLGARAALGQHRNGQPHQYQHQGHQGNGQGGNAACDGSVVGCGHAGVS